MKRRLIQSKCVQNLLRRGITIVPSKFKYMGEKLVPVQEHDSDAGEGGDGLKIPVAGDPCERLGALVANCSSCGLDGRDLWVLA